MRRFCIALIICLSAIVFLSVPASAKEGFYFGFGLDYVEITGSDPYWDPVDPGTGFDIKLGWDSGPVAIESSLIGSSHENIYSDVADDDFAGLTLDVRILFGPSDLPTRGFLLFGFGSYAFSETDIYGNEDILRGGGFNIGGGLEHFFNDVLALDARAVYRFIVYDELESNGITYAISDLDGDTFNLSIGLSIHF